MHPILFQYGAFTLYTYGVLAATGFLLGIWYACRQAPRASLDVNSVWNLGVYGILVSLAVSKIWLILSAWSYYSANPRQIFSVETFQSAGTFYGGVLGGLIWTVFYKRLKKMPPLPFLEVWCSP